MQAVQFPHALRHPHLPLHARKANTLRSRWQNRSLLRPAAVCLRTRPKRGKFALASCVLFLACVTPGKSFHSPRVGAEFLHLQNSKSDFLGGNTKAQEHTRTAAPFVQPFSIAFRLFEVDINFLNYRSFLLDKSLLIQSQSACFIPATPGSSSKDAAWPLLSDGMPGEEHSPALVFATWHPVHAHVSGLSPPGVFSGLLADCSELPLIPAGRTIQQVSSNLGDL